MTATETKQPETRIDEPGHAPGPPKNPVCMNVERARRLMATQGLDALIAYGQFNVAYLSGFVQYHWYWDGIQYFMDRNWMRDEAKAIAAFFLDPAKPAFVATNSWVARNNWIYESVDVLWKWKDLKFHANEFTYPQLEAAAQGLRDRGIEKARVGYDETRMPAYYLRYLQEQLPGVEFVPADALFWRIRAVKTTEEIRRLRKAFDIATRVYRETFAMMKPGVMLADIQRMQQKRASELGGVWYFNHLWVHTAGEAWDPPPDYRLRPGDEGGCDLGVYVGGYGCDFGRTVSLGKPHRDVQKDYDTYRAAYEAMIGACRIGNTTLDVVNAAHKIERELRDGKSAGCLGHGLGLECHESPAIMDGWDEPLEENMVVQIEVGGSPPGRNTFLFLEDAGVITPRGWEAMTDLERDIFVLS